MLKDTFASKDQRFLNQTITSRVVFVHWVTIAQVALNTHVLQELLVQSRGSHLAPGARLATTARKASLCPSTARRITSADLAAQLRQFVLMALTLLLSTKTCKMRPSVLLAKQDSSALKVDLTRRSNVQPGTSVYQEQPQALTKTTPITTVPVVSTASLALCCQRHVPTDSHRSQSLLESTVAQNALQASTVFEVRRQLSRLSVLLALTARLAVMSRRHVLRAPTTTKNWRPSLPTARSVPKVPRARKKESLITITIYASLAVTATKARCSQPSASKVPSDLCQVVTTRVQSYPNNRPSFKAASSALQDSSALSVV